MEDTKGISQGGKTFDGAHSKFEEACIEEIEFKKTRTEDSAARARSQRARNMAGYATGTLKDPNEEEEE